MSRLRLGSFWQEIRDEYPRTEEAEPLAAMSESLDPKVAGTLEFRDQWRDLLIHANDDRVVQLQRDRLQFNWRRGQNEAQYPRFASVLSGFHDHLARFEAFVQRETGHTIKPSQYEVTYINHIFEGEPAWRPAALLGELLPDFLQSF